MGNSAWGEWFDEHVPPLLPTRGESLNAKLDIGTGAAVVYVAGDSTGYPTVRWPRRLMTRIAADNADAAVDVYDTWDDTAKTYTHTAVQAGSTGDTGVAVHDTFNRDAADLIGSDADTGQTWAQQAANAQGDFSVSVSGGLLRTSNTPTAIVLIDSGVAGDRQVSLKGITNYSTVASGSTQNHRLYAKFADNSNYVYVGITISSTGVPSWAVAKLIGGVSTSVPGVGTILTKNAASQTIDLMQIAVAGATVTATITTAAGTFTQSLTLTSTDQAALAAATKDGFSAGPAGYTVTGSDNGFTTNITAVAPPALSVTMYNGSISGSVLTAQIGQLGTQCPVTPDLVIINSTHNYGTDTPSVYLAKLDSFVREVVDTWPSAGVAVMSQNPENPAIVANAAAHLRRLLALRAYCRQKGIGYIPVAEGFVAFGSWASLLKSDGVHPTDTGDAADASSGSAATNGCQLWERVVYAWLQEQSYADAYTD